MRQVLVVCVVLLLCGLALGQATVISGWGSNVGWGGYYPPTPFVPMVSTPSASFETYSPNAAGASNATAGLVAGATNATLSMMHPVVSNAYTVPVWSGSGAATSIEAEAFEHHGMHGMMHEHMAQAERALSLGSARSGMGSGIGESVKLTQANRQPAKRTYTNQDIERIQQQKGTVKYKGKTETIG